VGTGFGKWQIHNVTLHPSKRCSTQSVSISWLWIAFKFVSLSY